MAPGPKPGEDPFGPRGAADRFQPVCFGVFSLKNPNLTGDFSPRVCRLTLIRPKITVSALSGGNSGDERPRTTPDGRKDVSRN
jgi:hypothetical protein